MIKVRDDDVLVKSSSGKDSFRRFKGVHETICKAADHLIHVPTILVEEIQDFPEAIEYIRHETFENRMNPELHGLRHIDYDKLSKDEIRLHLSQAACWFKVHLNYYPTRWYTPWGATSPELIEVASECGLQLVSKSTKMNGRYGIIQGIRDGRQLEMYPECIIHWWNDADILRLNMLVDFVNGDASAIGS